MQGTPGPAAPGNSFLFPSPGFLPTPLGMALASPLTTMGKLDVTVSEARLSLENYLAEAEGHPSLILTLPKIDSSLLGPSNGTTLRGHNADNECLELFPAAQRQNHNQADEETNFYLEDKQTSQFEKHAHEVMSTVRKQLGRRESDPYCKKIEEDLLNLVKEKSDFSGAALTLTQLAKENFSKDDKPSDLIPAAWPSAKRPAVEALDSLAFDGYERNNKRHKPMDTLPSAIVGPRGRRPDHLEKMAKLEAEVAALRPQIHGLQNELEDAERDIVVTKHQNDQVWGAVHQVHVMIKLALEAEKTQGQGFIEPDTQAHSLQAPNNIMPIPSPALAGFLSPFDNDLFDALSMFVSPELRRGEEVGNAEAKPAQRLQFTTTKVPQAGC